MYPEVLWESQNLFYVYFSLCQFNKFNHLKKSWKTLKYNMGWQLCNAHDQILAWKQFWWMAVVDGHTFAFYQSFQNALPWLTVIYLGLFHQHILDSSNSSSVTFWTIQFLYSSRWNWTSISTGNSNGSWTEKHSPHFSTAKEMSEKASFFFM